MWSGEDVHRSVRRWVATVLGSPPWTVSMERKEIPLEGRPHVFVEAITPTQTTRSRVSIPQGPVTKQRSVSVQCYPDPKTDGTAREARAEAEAVAGLLDDAVTLGLVLPADLSVPLPERNLGGPSRIPLYDYDGVPLEGPNRAGPEEPHAYIWVDDYSVRLIPDPNDDHLWTVVADLRLSWDHPGRDIAPAPTVAAVYPSFKPPNYLFQPNMLSPMLLWVEADSLVGQLSDGDPVELWADASPTLTDLVQIVVDEAPIFREDVGGLPAVEFDGLSSWLMSAGDFDFSPSDFTAFVVVECPDGQPAASGFLIDRGDTDIAIGSDEDGLLFEASSSLSLDATAKVTTGQLTGGSLLMMLGGSSEFTFSVDTLATGQGNTSVSGSQSLDLTVGARGDGGAGINFFAGSVRAILLYGAALEPLQREAVGDYLRYKYLKS